MKSYKFFIHSYKWTIEVYYGPYTDRNCNDIIKELRDLKVPEEMIYSVFNGIQDHINTGHTFSCDILQKQIIIFTPFTSYKEYQNIVAHEVRHMTNHICEAHQLEEEGGAYLTGDIMDYLFEIGFVGDVLDTFGIKPLSADQNKLK